MIRNLTIVLFIALAPVACAGGHSSENLQRTVRPHSSQVGVYLVYYRYMEMINEYGPGLENVRKSVRLQPDVERQLAVWDDVLEVAVPKYLEAKNLIPNACGYGVEIMRSQGDEGGGGTSTFRCK